MPVGIATSAAPVAVLVAIVAWVGKVFVLAIAVTVVESTNAKLRLFRVPELVSISLGLGFLALAIRSLRSFAHDRKCADPLRRRDVGERVLMVGQKALFTTIRLYGLQSLLLAIVATTMAISESRPELFVTAALTVVLKTILIPWFLMRTVDRIGIHREIEPFLNVLSLC